MNKTKIGVAVLLLGLSLGPVQTSQNYSIRLNNLAYAEGETAQPSTGEGSSENGQTNPSKETEKTGKTEDQVGEKKEGQTGEEKKDQTEEKKEEPKAPTEDEKLSELAKARGRVKKALADEDKAIKESEAYNLATKAEIQAYEEAFKLLDESVNNQITDESQAKDIENIEKDFRRNLISESLVLGYTVVDNLSVRIGLRNLKADLDAASKEAKNNKKADLPSELKNLASETDKILASKEYSTEDIKANYKALSEALDKYKKDNSINIPKSDLGLEEAKYGYPDDVYTKNRGKVKDLSEVRLDAKVALDESKIDDKKVEERLSELKKKIDDNTASEAEKSEQANLQQYQLAKLALNSKVDDPDADANDLLKSVTSYLDLSKNVIIESSKPDDSEEIKDYRKRLKDLRESDKSFRESDKFKNADEELKKKYEAAFKGLDGITEYSLDAKSKIEAVEASKKAIDEAEANKAKEELDKKVNEALNDKFKESDKYKRATEDLQKAYDTAYDALKDKKGQTELDQVAKAKKDIEDYYDEFNTKYDALEKYIDQAKSDKRNDESLKKLKEEYKKKLEGYKTDFSKKVTDIDALEKEFNEKLNSADANKKTTKKVVATKKTAGGKVRTGVERVLPIAGGVLVVAAIALVLTRKKNK